MDRKLKSAMTKRDSLAVQSKFHPKNISDGNIIFHSNISVKNGHDVTQLPKQSHSARNVVIFDSSVSIELKTMLFMYSKEAFTIILYINFSVVLDFSIIQCVLVPEIQYNYGTLHEIYLFLVLIRRNCVLCTNKLADGASEPNIRSEPSTKRAKRDGF